MMMNYNRNQKQYNKVFEVYRVVKTAPRFRMIEGKGGLMNGKIS